MKKRRSEERAAWLFLAPSLAGIAVLVLVPFLETVRRSFYNDPGTRFLGLQNYRSVLENPAFRLAAANTGKLLLVSVPALLLISLILALLVKPLGRRGQPFRTGFLFPLAIPVASISLLWRVVFADNGLCNGMLGAMGAEPVRFMGSNAAFWVLLFTFLWKNSGYHMALWLAGMDGISPALYEAAALDGAGSFRQLWYITLPNLLPTLGMLWVLGLINTFKVFREAWLVAGNYPHESMYLMQHLFQNWFRSLDIGRLSAGAVMMALVLLSVPIVLGQLLVGGSAAWALSRLRFRGRRGLVMLYILLMILPFQVTMTPNYLVLDGLGLMDTVWAVILPGIFATFPVFLMMRFFDGIPRPVVDCANLDGANHWQIFWYIGLPLGRPGIFAAMVLTFLERWSAVEEPLTFLRDGQWHPLSLKLGQDAEISTALGAGLVALIPAVLVFRWGQKYLELGIGSGTMEQEV